jgi:hypothetical protein
MAELADAADSKIAAVLAEHRKNSGFFYLRDSLC